MRDEAALRAQDGGLLDALQTDATDHSFKKTTSQEENVTKPDETHVY